MASFRKDTQEFLSQATTIFEVPMIANKNGQVVSNSNPFPVTFGALDTTTNQVNIGFPEASLAAFEELMVVEPRPIIQLDSTYGIDAYKLNTIQSDAGSVTANNGMWQINPGNTAPSVAALTSKRYVRYRPGTGTLARFTALFTCDASGNGVENATQMAGMFNPGNAYAFGFSGGTGAEAKFGILHRYGGKLEVRTLTINTAPNATQTVTVTLNGVAYEIVVAAGTAAECAKTISSHDFGDVWNADQVDGKVIFSAVGVGARSGTYSFSSTGNATGSYTTQQTGVGNTTDWTYQADWNGTPVTIDPSKLNVFGIDMRWLGAGQVRFFMEDPSNGKMVLVHTQIWSNQHTIPHLNNPSMRIGYYSIIALGQTTLQDPIVKGASMYGAIQGGIAQTTYSESWFATNTTNRGTGSIWHLLSIKNPYTKSNLKNTHELILKNVNVSFQGNDPVVVYMFLNPASATGQRLFTTIPESDVLVSTTGTSTISTGVNNPIAAFAVGINGTESFDLMPYRTVLAPGDVVSVAFSSTQAVTRSAVTLTWGTE